MPDNVSWLDILASSKPINFHSRHARRKYEARWIIPNQKTAERKIAFLVGKSSEQILHSQY